MEDRIATQVRLPRALNDRLRREARARDVGVSLMVAHAVERYLDALVPVDQFTGAPSDEIAEQIGLGAGR